MLVIEQEALPVLLGTVPQALQTLIPLLYVARCLPLSWRLLPDTTGSSPGSGILLQREEPLEEGVGLQLLRSRVRQLLLGDHALATSGWGLESLRLRGSLPRLAALPPFPL